MHSTQQLLQLCIPGFSEGSIMYGNHWMNRIEKNLDNKAVAKDGSGDEEEFVINSFPSHQTITPEPGKTYKEPGNHLYYEPSNQGPVSRFIWDILSRIIPESVYDKIAIAVRDRVRFTSFQLIMWGFMMVILTGAILLRLPIASNPGTEISFLDALFTATSATCVTGLVVADTARTWTFFGQLVILTLIQIGGMGIVTVAIILFALSGKKIGLRQRSIMQESISAPSIGGIVKMAGFIVKGMLLFEFLGAYLMMPVMIRDFGSIKGFWYAIFHSISAFCNAGFDLMGMDVPYSSLTAYVDDPLINITIMSLIVIGGIGFFTWNDIYTHKLTFRTYSMQTKAILELTLALILIPALIFYMTEYRTMPFKERVLASMFQSITPRTAGFNTTDYGSFSDKNILLTIVLMLTGGASGSTAGGFKVTTLAVILASAHSIFFRSNDVVISGRRISEKTIRTALSIFMMYVVLFLGAAVCISSIDDLPLRECLFESASAIGTVGLTMGITTKLSALSQLIIIVLMFLGRVGGLTVIFATTKDNYAVNGRKPEGNITIG